MKLTVLLAVSFLAMPSCLAGQQDREAARPGARQVTAVAGFGNAMGWLGVQAEFHFARERLSAFGGLGYTPEIDQGDPTGLTLAAGVRAYTPGIKHRGFVELSLSQVAIGGLTSVLVEDVVPPIFVLVKESERHYGPGIQAGYQYVTAGGFTFVVSAGFGYALGVDDSFALSSVGALGGLGLGYTWRKP